MMIFSKTRNVSLSLSAIVTLLRSTSTVLHARSFVVWHMPYGRGVLGCSSLRQQPGAKGTALVSGPMGRAPGSGRRVSSFSLFFHCDAKRSCVLGLLHSVA